MPTEIDIDSIKNTNLFILRQANDSKCLIIWSQQRIHQDTPHI